jgi:beta-lactamase regulating signal transducer with metallopeptidase domain
MHHLLESTLVCVLLGACAACLRRCSAAVRHGLWLVSILKFAIPTVLLAATGAWMAAVLPATEWMLSFAPRLLTVLRSLFGAFSFPSDVSSGAGALLAIWVTGTVAMLGTWIYRLRRTYRTLRETTFQYRGCVALCFTDAVSEMALVGFFTPVIAVPRGLVDRLTAPEFEAVLLHEIAHAKRRDNLTGAFVHCLVCLFWFHPLLWYVEKKLIAERERACDEMVMSRGTNPQVYLAGLTKACGFQLFGDLAGVSAVGGSNLQTRFAQIAAYRAARPVPYVVRLAVAAVALLITILPIAGGYCEQCVSDGQMEAGQK